MDEATAKFLKQVAIHSLSNGQMVVSQALDILYRLTIDMDDNSQLVRIRKQISDVHGSIFSANSDLRSGK